MSVLGVVLQRGGHRAEGFRRDRGRQHLLVFGPRPTLVELDKEVRVGEGPAVDDGLQQVDEDHHQNADEDEGDEGSEVVQDHHGAVAQAALLPRVGGPATGGQRRPRRLILVLRGTLGRVKAARVHRERQSKRKEETRKKPGRPDDPLIVRANPK